MKIGLKKNFIAKIHIMNHLANKVIYIFLFAFLLISMPFLSSCGKKNSAEERYLLYYPDYSGEALLSKDIYFSKDLETKELIDDLVKAITENDENDGMALPDEVDIISATLNKKTHDLAMDFSAGYTSLSGYKETILRASIVKTMLQVNGVKSVTFYVRGQALTDSTGYVIGAMTSDTFVEDFGKDQTALIAKNVKLYYAALDGKSLVAVSRTLHYGSSTGLEQTVVTTLSKTPYEEDLRAVYSDASKILNVSVSDGICFLDIDSSFFTDMEDVSLDVALYSLVNSLTSLDGISKVSITVYSNGAPDTNGNYPSGNFEKNMDLVSLDESGLGE